MIQKLGLTATIASALLLSGCGGGGGNAPTNASISSTTQQTTNTSTTQESLKLTVDNVTIDSESTLSRVSKTVQEGTQNLAQISLNVSNAKITLEGKNASNFELLKTVSGQQLQFKAKANVGEYEVDIKASDDKGHSVVYKVKYIVSAKTPDNKPPVVNAGNDITMIENQTITLEGTATDEDGNIVSYEWKLEDQVLATSASFEYTPTSVGTDTLVFSATDDDGITTTDEIIITVTKPNLPDLKIISARLFDQNGNEITENNKLEAGEQAGLVFEVTVKNIGNKNIPQQDKYLVSYEVDLYEKVKIEIPELGGLEAGAETTFTFSMAKDWLENTLDGNAITISVNAGRNLTDDEKNTTFEELNISNNSFNGFNAHIHQTDVSFTDLKVKILNDQYQTIRDTNTIDLSEDNKQGNKVYYCLKIKNSGSHKLRIRIWNHRLLLKSGVASIGDHYTYAHYIKLAAGATSSEKCFSYDLPRNFTADSYTLTFDGSGISDSDTSNNIESITYTIQD